MGRPGQIAGTRELIPHENYRLVYEISNETVLGADADPHLTPVATPTAAKRPLTQTDYAPQAVDVWRLDSRHHSAAHVNLPGDGSGDQRGAAFL